MRGDSGGWQAGARDAEGHSGQVTAADEAKLATLERTVEHSFRTLVAPPRPADGMSAGAQALAERLTGEDTGRSYAQWLAER
ncbi:hypothetical protein V5F34_22675 [Xanthobacter autotrophicus]|uniref:hypothetical protein n=1 Tax=Xanthobacter autotrophicus TaxID=280 RepID=UPI003727D5F3